MNSILTNNSAMAALSTLRSISSSMEDTQSRISSGLRVGSASDNAAYWSIATTIARNQALSAVQDALGSVLPRSPPLFRYGICDRKS